YSKKRRGSSGFTSAAGRIVWIRYPSGNSKRRENSRSGEREISTLSFGEIHTSITCWRRLARSIAVLRKLTTVSDTERRRRDSTPAAALGKAMPVTSAISVSTINSSMSVMPARRLFVAPTDNVGVVPFSTGLAVGAQRNDVRLISVIAGEFVEIRMAPRVFRRVLRQIRTGPLI